MNQFEYYQTHGFTGALQDMEKQFYDLGGPVLFNADYSKLIRPDGVEVSYGGGTTIVGITGTIAQFNTAVTDADLAILGANSFADTQQSRAMLIDSALVAVDKGNSGTTTQTLDYTAGSVQQITATGNFTIATSNWPPTGNWGVIQLELVNGGAFTITWPTINWIKPDGTTTTSFSTWLAAATGRTALQTSGIDKIKLESKDAGVTLYGRFA